MFQQPWQRRQNAVLHASVALLWGGSVFWLQTALPAWEKLLLIAGTISLALLAAHYLQRKYANTLIKVFRAERDVVARRVQRVFSQHYVPFRKRTESEAIRFEVRDRGLALVVESFPLNLPIDDHIVPVPATRIVLKHLSPENMDLSLDLCRWIDEACAAG